MKCEHEFEPGKRLYIRKDTLRRWREQLAELMREQGVPANATPRQLRGQTRGSLKDPIHHRLRAVRAYRALPLSERSAKSQPPGSSFMRARLQEVAAGLREPRIGPNAGKERLVDTRHAVIEDWLATVENLQRQGETSLALRLEQFVEGLPTPRADQERIAFSLLKQLTDKRLA